MHQAVTVDAKLFPDSGTFSRHHSPISLAKIKNEPSMSGSQSISGHGPGHTTKYACLTFLVPGNISCRLLTKSLSHHLLHFLEQDFALETKLPLPVLAARSCFGHNLAKPLPLLDLCLALPIDLFYLLLTPLALFLTLLGQLSFFFKWGWLWARWSPLS